MLFRELGIPALAALGLVASACGASSSGSSNPGSSTPAPPAASASPAASPASSGAASIEQASVTVSGMKETVLTTSDGFTLYYLTSDGTKQSKCTGGCASAWPPLLSSGTPSSMTPLSGSLAVVNDANGQQVAYNGHLLYRYAADSAKGQTHGEGVTDGAGTWHVATPGLAAAKASPAAGGGGTGYGY